MVHTHTKSKHDLKREHENAIKESANVIERFESFMEISNRSERSISKALGKSQSYVNQWRHQSLNISTETLQKFDKTVLMFLKREYARMQTPKRNFIDTSISREVLAALHRCYVRNEMGIVYARPGVGKTVSARKFIEENPECLLVTAFKGFSMKAVLLELCEQLGIAKYVSNLYAIRRIVEDLSGSDRMIVVDEAQFLNLQSLEIVRSIHDRSRVGVVYIGQPELNRRMKGIDAEFYAQIYSRIAVQVELDEPSYQDIADLAADRDVTDKKVLHFLYDHMQSKLGSIRTVCHLLDYTAECAELENAKITVAYMKNCAGPRIIQ